MKTVDAVDMVVLSARATKLCLRVQTSGRRPDVKFLQEGPIGLDNAAVYPPRKEQAGTDSREDCHRKKKRIENVRLHHGGKRDWLNGHTMGSGRRSHLDACWRQASRW
jgi:hypothetical protein